MVGYVQAVSPSDPDVLLAGIEVGGVLRSDHRGRTWSRARGLDRRYGWAVAADPDAPDTVFVSAAPGPRSHGGDATAAVFRRRQDERWMQLAGGLPEPLPSMPYALITDPGWPGNVFLGLGNGQIWHKVDHGDSWAMLAVDMVAIERNLVML